MSRLRAVSVTRFVVLPIAVFVLAVCSGAQSNLYREVENWPQLPANLKLGAVISVDVDPKGNIWVFHRNQPPILELDPSGKLLTSFGTDMFVQPHGMTIDREGNIWVTDAQDKAG